MARDVEVRRGLLRRAAATSRRPRPSTSAYPLDDVDAGRRRAAADAAPSGLARRAAAQRPVRARVPRYRVLRPALRGARARRDRHDAEGLRAARDGRRGLPDRQEVGAGARRRRPTPASTRSATPTSPSRAPSRTARSSPSSRTSCSRACCSGCSSTGAEEGWVFIRHEYEPEEEVLREEIERCASRACSGRRAGHGRRLRSTSSPRRAATSSARRPRCSSAWRATAASRATSRRSPASAACGASPTLMNTVETFADVPVIARARRASGGRTRA